MTARSHVARPAKADVETFHRAESAIWARHGLAPTERLLGGGSRGSRLRVLEVGSGAPILLVHGTVGPGAWPSLIEALGGSRRFLALDRPGWGGSDPTEYAGRDYRALAAATLRRVLDELDIERVTVVGGSIGNVWALALAQLDPSRVERVVLLGGGPLLAELTPPRFIRLIASPLGALIVRLPTSAARTRSILTGSGHGPALADGRIPDEFIAYRVALSNASPALRHERAMVRAVLGRSGWRAGFPFSAADLRTIEAPTLMVIGSADEMGDAPTWYRFAATLPHGSIRMLEGAGHMPWFDEPVATAGAIRRFLDGPDPAGTPAQAGRSRSAGPT